MDCYIESLASHDQAEVEYLYATNSYKFGSGNIYKSLYKIKVPAKIGIKKVFIESGDVETNIPMLLSRTAMKKAATFINFKDDTVNMLGQKQDIVVTSSGHYAIPLSDRLKVLQDINSNRNTRVTLHVESKYDLKQIAVKLNFHTQGQNDLYSWLRTLEWMIRLVS
jgi:hypothetical protein